MRAANYAYGSPFECAHYGCTETALYFVSGWACGPTCDHAHLDAHPFCEEHSKKQGREIVGTTGD